MRWCVVILTVLVFLLTLSPAVAVNLVLEHEYALNTLPVPVNGIRLGDVDGDSVPEALVLSGQALYVFSIAHDSVLFEIPRPTTAYSSNYVFADVNRDHKADIVTLDYSIVDSSSSNLTVGTFIAYATLYDGADFTATPVVDTITVNDPPGMLNVGGSPSFIGAVDQDGDGFDELVISTDTIPGHQCCGGVNDNEFSYTPVTKCYYRFPDSVNWSRSIKLRSAVTVPDSLGTPVLFGESHYISWRTGMFMDWNYSYVDLVQFNHNGSIRSVFGAPGFQSCTGYDITNRSTSITVLCAGYTDRELKSPRILATYSWGSHCITGNPYKDESYGGSGNALLTFGGGLNELIDRQTAYPDNPRFFLIHPDFPHSFLAMYGYTLRQYGLEDGAILAQATPIEAATISGWVRVPYDSLPRLLAYAGQTIRLYAVTTATNVQEPDPDGLPVSFELGQLYPNPFNGQLSIPLAVKIKQRVAIDIINMAGQTVARVADREFTAGNHTLEWDADGVSSGVYLVRAASSDGARTRKAVLVK